MHALLDGDIVAYRSAASAENEPVEVALIRTDKFIQDILYKTSAESFKCYLSGSTNFRKEIYPLYKANRIQPKPIHLEACRELLCVDYNASITDGHEADDELGMAQRSNTIICSIDKDLLQIPGSHYNIVKEEFSEIGEFEGLVNFYTQMLVGDKSDNIEGIRGIGPVKARKYLEGCQSELELFDTVQNLYSDDYRLLMNGQLLWIWRTYKGIWQPPKNILIGQNQYKHVEEVKSEFTPMMQEAAD